MGLIKIREEIHNSILILRRLECIIEKDSFNTLWESLNSDEQKILEGQIKDLEYEEVKYWVESHKHILELGEMGCRELRLLASRYGIKNYSRLQKYELIQHLKGYIDGSKRNAGENGITNNKDVICDVESGDKG